MHFYDLGHLSGSATTRPLLSRYFLAGVIGYAFGLLATFVSETQLAPPRCDPLAATVQRNRLTTGHRTVENRFAAWNTSLMKSAHPVLRSLYLMQHGQPALLFLVPGTLV